MNCMNKLHSRIKIYLYFIYNKNTWYVTHQMVQKSKKPLHLIAEPDSASMINIRAPSHTITRGKRRKEEKIQSVASNSIPIEIPELAIF